MQITEDIELKRMIHGESPGFGIQDRHRQIAVPFPLNLYSMSGTCFELSTDIEEKRSHLFEYGIHQSLRKVISNYSIIRCMLRDRGSYTFGRVVHLSTPPAPPHISRRSACALRMFADVATLRNVLCAAHVPVGC